MFVNLFKMRFSHCFYLLFCTSHTSIFLSCLSPLYAATVPTKDVSKSSDVPKTLYLSQHCRTVIWNLILDHEYVFLDDQAYVMAHPLSDINSGPAYIKQGLCVVTFAAPPGHQLLLHIVDMAIDYRPTHKSRLYIFDGFNAEVKISPYNGLYGEMKSKGETFTNVVSKDYLSHYQALTLVFSGTLSKRFYGFKAILTPVKRPFRNGTCASGFLCAKNRYCIDRSLLCNGIPNCGDRDNSDEGDQCNVNAKYHLSHSSLDDLGLMIGCGVSVLVLLLAVIWVAVLIQKRQRLRQERLRLRATTRQHPPVQQGASYARPPLRDHPMWFPYQLPRGLYQWICPDAPPPAYSESGNNQQVCFDTPPPYSQAVQDPQHVQNIHQVDDVTSDGETTAAGVQQHHVASPPAYSDIDQGTVLPLLSETREPVSDVTHNVNLKDDEASENTMGDNQSNRAKEQADGANGEVPSANDVRNGEARSASSEPRTLI